VDRLYLWCGQRKSTLQMQPFTVLVFDIATPNAWGEKGRFHRGLPAETAMMERSFGSAPSSTIVLNSMPENNRHWHEHFPCSISCSRRSRLMGKWRQKCAFLSGEGRRMYLLGLRSAERFYLGHLAETNKPCFIQFTRVSLWYRNPQIMWAKTALRRDASFGSAASLTIVLETTARRTNICKSNFPRFTQSQSPFTDDGNWCQNAINEFHSIQW